MEVDYSLLSTLYTEKLQQLRKRAESSGISKSGSVEVLRARLIRKLVINYYDLSWEGIQSLSNLEIGKILKIFGIKSSGSHKERRQRLWLHLNYDSRRLTIGYLAEMNKDNLHQLCKELELELSGNRTVLMGHVAGVLTSQLNGWGRIKRSLRRNGINSPISRINEKSNSNSNKTKPHQDFNYNKVLTQAMKEDSVDYLINEIDKFDSITQDDLRSLQSRIDDLERMVGTILNGFGGNWGNNSLDLLIRLLRRRGWPIENTVVRNRITKVATNIAEFKGANFNESLYKLKLENSESTINRLRQKLSGR